MIGPNEFYDPLHRRIWTAMADLHADGEIATPLTLAAHLAADRGLNTVAGREYLLSLARASSLHPNIAEYARLLSDLALRRKLDDAALGLHAALPDRARTPMECAGAMLDAAAAELRMPELRMTGEAASFTDTDDEGWEARLASARKTASENGAALARCWSKAWGPPPGSEGCRVPEQVLAKFTPLHSEREGS